MTAHTEQAVHAGTPILKEAETRIANLHTSSLANKIQVPDLQDSEKDPVLKE